MPLALLDSGVRAVVAAVVVIILLWSPTFLRLSDPIPLPPPPPSANLDEAASTVISVCAALLAVMGGWMWTVGLGGMVGAGLRREMVGGTERRRREGGGAFVPRQIMQTARIVVSSVKLDMFGSDDPTASPLPTTGVDASGPPVAELGYVEFIAAVAGRLELHLGVPGVDLEQENIRNVPGPRIDDNALKTAPNPGNAGDTAQSGDAGIDVIAAAGVGHRAVWFRSDTESRVRFGKGRNRVGLTELVAHDGLVAAAAAAAAATPGLASAAELAGPRKPGKRRSVVQWPAVLLFLPDEAEEVGCCTFVAAMSCRPAGSSTAGRSSTVPATITASLRIAQSLAVTAAGDILELQQVFEPELASGGGDGGANTVATCTICLDEKCTAVLMPCRHRCVCHVCLPRIERVCPICRCRIEYVMDEDTPAESTWL